MVNTRVSDPARRKLNRKLGRQKKARTRQSEKLLDNPEDGSVALRISRHSDVIAKLKDERNKLDATSPSANRKPPKVLRTLDGISYWVLEDPDEISELVNLNIRKEWESDIAEQEDHEEGRWLQTLKTRLWRLEEMDLGKIKLSSDIMDYVNRATGYNFRNRLEQRKAMLERDIDRFGAIIRPVVIRAEDSQLMDGYCRYHVLKDRNVERTYAYVGGL